MPELIELIDFVQFNFHLTYLCQANYRRFSFKAEWYQSEANIMRAFILNFYPDDNGIEIVCIIPIETVWCPVGK